MSTYALVRNYTLNPAYLDEGIDLGTGVDLRDPTRPVVAPYAAFAPAEREDDPEAPKKFGLETSEAAIRDLFRFETASSEVEEGLIIAEHFTASYGLSSAGEAGRHASELRKSFYTTYAILEHAGEPRVLGHRDDRRWAAPPLADDPAADLDELRERFFDAFGTHYVSEIRYGLRIAIQAKTSNSSAHTADALAASFQAACGGVGAKGGVSVERQKALEDMGVTITCEISSGGAAGRALPALTSLPAVDKYLKQLSGGGREYSVGPISVSVKDYLPTLDPSWAVYRALRSTVERMPRSEFGVPLGTVVPWSPPSEYVRTLRPPEVPDDHEVHLHVTPPAGWAICDGTGGTPDLRDRFVRGMVADSWKGSSPLGGSREKVTLVTGGGPVGDALPRGSLTSFHPSNYGHTHTVELPEPQLPPYSGLIYIMRVA